MTTKEYLQQIDDVITNGKYKDSWESLSITKHRTGITTASSEFLFTGVFIVFLPTAVSGIQEQCMIKTAVNLNITEKPMVRRINSVIRILSLCSRLKI